MLYGSDAIRQPPSCSSARSPSAWPPPSAPAFLVPAGEPGRYLRLEIEASDGGERPILLDSPAALPSAAHIALEAAAGQDGGRDNQGCAVRGGVTEPDVGTPVRLSWWSHRATTERASRLTRSNSPARPARSISSSRRRASPTPASATFTGASSPGRHPASCSMRGISRHRSRWKACPKCCTVSYRGNAGSPRNRTAVSRSPWSVRRPGFRPTASSSYRRTPAQKRVRQPQGHVSAYAPEFHEAEGGRGRVDTERREHDADLVERRSQGLHGCEGIDVLRAECFHHEQDGRSTEFPDSISFLEFSRGYS